MASLVPRPPYTEDELETLYPETLQLQQVQIVSTLGLRAFLALSEHTCLPINDRSIGMANVVLFPLDSRMYAHLSGFYIPLQADEAT